MRQINLGEIEKWLTGQTTQTTFNRTVMGYQIDSRNVRLGDLFFALPGEKTDGHQFLSAVKEQGAIGAVIANAYQGDTFGLLIIQVPDVLKALQQLAKKMLELYPILTIGVTGSVGKTTTKEFIASLLSQNYRVAKSPQSFNSKRTLPISVLNRNQEDNVLVLEMGMSAPQEIKDLVDIAPIDIGVVTQVALAHAYNFPGGIEEIAKEKSSIFSSPRIKHAIFHGDCLRFAQFQLPAQGKTHCFSLGKYEGYQLLADGNKGQVVVDGKVALECTVLFKEAHFLENCIAAICVADIVGIPWPVIGEIIPKLQTPSERFEKIEKKGILWINDAYNANPASMRAALLSIPKGRRRVGVLGAMKELGSFSESAHRELGGLAKEHLDALFVFDEEALGLYETFKESGKSAYFFTKKIDLHHALESFIQRGDVVLVKGSRSLQMEECIP